MIYDNLIEKIENNITLWEKVKNEIDTEFLGKISLTSKEKLFLEKLEKMISLLEYNNLQLLKIKKVV